MDYHPSPSCTAFMNSDALVKCIIGPLGSGKSMAGIMELFRRACEQEADDKGIRPTRFAIVRNTLSQLRMTFLSDCLQYLSDFFIYKVSDQMLSFRFRLPDGTRVESDWMLLPLERPEDARKLLSLNITAALIEECREVKYDVVAAVLGRVGRYPSLARVAPTWQALLLISNPWSESSSYHDHFVMNKPKGWVFIQMPGGLDPEAENVEFLPKDYYERLMDGHSDEWIKVHVHGQFGEDQFGQAVYRSSFSRASHVAAKGLRANTLLPIIIGLDFGRTPSAAFTQRDTFDRILCLRELTTEDMNLNQFCQDLLIPTMREYYPANRFFFVGDPAGVQRSQHTEETSFTILKDYDLDAIPAPTNEIMARIRAVEKALLSVRSGKPGFLLDEDLCPKLLAGFLRDYRYKKQRTGELTPAPEKNDASHIQDALQYALLGQQSNYVGRRVLMRTQPGVQRAVPNAAAWT